MKKSYTRFTGHFNDHADAPGQYGASNCPMATTSDSAWSPGCDLRAKLHQRIRMVIKMASEPCVFFSSSTRDKSSTITIIKLIYCFKQNQEKAPSATSSGGLPMCLIWHIHIIHAVGGANNSPWWGWLGVVLCFEQHKKMYYSYVGILRSDSFWFLLEQT